MKSSGISTAISETVSEMIVKPISDAPASAASMTMRWRPFGSDSASAPLSVSGRSAAAASPLATRGDRRAGDARSLARQLEVARDVLDHHDRVVDDEAGRDRQRHQAQVVEAVAEQVHRAEAADQRDRHRQAGDHGRARAAEEGEDDEHDHHDREHELDLDVPDRGADAGRAVGEHLDAQVRRQRRLQVGQLLLDRVDGRDHVGARLALDVEDDRRAQLAVLAGPGAEARVLGALDHPGDVDQAHRRAVLVGDDQLLVVVGGEQLVVGVDRVRALRPVEAALGAVRVGRRDRRAQRVDADAVRRQRLRVGLDPHRRPLAAGERDQADAA